MLWAWWGGFPRRFARVGSAKIVYQQMGATRSAIARSEDGRGIGKEEEVYVLRYEKGIAYVKRWEDLPEANLQGIRDQGTGNNKQDLGTRELE